MFVCVCASVSVYKQENKLFYELHIACVFVCVHACLCGLVWLCN